QWDEMFDVNLKGAFLFCRALVPHMKKRRSGHIINIASVAGLVTFPRGAGYCASKWGMVALTETLIQELKPYELKVPVICPGSGRLPDVMGSARLPRLDWANTLLPRVERDVQLLRQVYRSAEDRYVELKQLNAVGRRPGGRLIMA